MSQDLADLIRGATPEARANLRSALDAADQADADVGQLSQEDLKAMSPHQILEAHQAGKLNRLTGSDTVEIARAARKDRRR